MASCSTAARHSPRLDDDEGTAVRLALTALIASLWAVSAQAATDPAMAFPKAPIVLPAGHADASVWQTLNIDSEQTEIATSIDSGRIMSNAGGGGLIGSLIIMSAVNTKPKILRNLKDKADIGIASIRAGLKDFDVDGLALATVRRGAASMGLQDASSITVTKAPALEAWHTAQQAAGTTPRAMVFLQYDASPDFMQIRVLARLLIEEGQPGKARTLAYLPILSIVQLRENAFDPDRNAQAWGKDNAALARQALTAAFAQIEHLLPRAVALTESDVALWSAKMTPKVFAAGFNGPLIERTANGGTVLWQNALISVETAP